MSAQTDKVEWIEVRVKWPDGRDYALFINKAKTKTAEIVVNGTKALDLLTGKDIAELVEAK